LRPGLRVIAASGYSEDEVLASPQRFGFAGRLVKPFRKEDLAQVVERCTDRRGEA
jgi:CheY-like chemotaxis protein